MNFDLLQTELTTDPLARGYAGMSDAAAATSLNAANRNVITPSLASSLVRQIIAAQATEYAALTEANRAMLTFLTQAGTVDLTNVSVRTVLLAIFAAGSATRAALTAAAVTVKSRAAELGLPVLTAEQVAWCRTHWPALKVLDGMLTARWNANQARKDTIRDTLAPAPETLAALDALE